MTYFRLLLDEAQSLVLPILSDENNIPTDNDNTQYNNIVLAEGNSVELEETENNEILPEQYEEHSYAILSDQNAPEAEGTEKSEEEVPPGQNDE